MYEAIPFPFNARDSDRLLCTIKYTEQTLSLYITTRFILTRWNVNKIMFFMH